MAIPVPRPRAVWGVEPKHPVTYRGEQRCGPRAPCSGVDNGEIPGRPQLRVDGEPMLVMPARAVVVRCRTGMVILARVDTFGPTRTVRSEKITGVWVMSVELNTH